jgi:hypothetical protein
MDDELVKQVYNHLKGEIDQIMDKNNLDFCSMSKIMHKLVENFDHVVKQRYP